MTDAALSCLSLIKSDILLDMNLSQTLPQKLVALKPQIIVYTTQTVPEHINLWY